MIDGHVHLEKGPLTKEYVYEFIDNAKAKGVKTIQILDHTHRFVEFKTIYDDLKTIEIQNIWLQGSKKFCDSVHTFISLMKEIQQEEKEIEVLYGLEVCFTPNNEEFLNQILPMLELDFIVGAIHSIDGVLYDMDFSKDLLWEMYEANFIYKRYYDLVFMAVKSDLFTQIAHPDTIKLFNYYPSYDLTPTYLNFAKLCNDHDIKVENNTGCHYRYNHKDVGLSNELLNILQQEHVKIITASDAHSPHDVGAFIQDLMNNKE